METKINIAEILRNKPHDIKLYSPIFGDCTFCYVREDTNDICVKKHNGVKEFFDSKGLYYKTGEVMLFPSKSMRDWEKLSWKRGDVLIGDCGFVCIFKEWESDDYTRFNGCYFDGMPNAQTAKYSKLDNNTAYGYIRELEKRCGGVLNIKTLKIEKPEFKDGDIVFEEGNRNYCSAIGVLKKDEQGCFMFDTFLTKDKVCYNSEYIYLPIRLATEEEKKQFFSALAKEGKRWDSNKKSIVDLKTKVDELKPFDKVLVRDVKDEIWEPAFFFRYLSQFSGYNYQTVGGEWRVYCVPYIGNESLLGTTKDVEG